MINTSFNLLYKFGYIPSNCYTSDHVKNVINRTIDYALDEINILNEDIIKNPIFIIGCGHSGTTLFNKLLGHHSNIYSLKDESYIFINNNLTHDDKIYIFKLWTMLSKKMGKKRWVEKTPKHVNHIDDIYNFFPDAKIIVLTRNGRAVSSSIKERDGTFIGGINRWLEDNLEWIQNKNKDKFLVIKYEDIIRNTEDTFRNVCDFIDEEYEDLSNTNNNIENIDLLPVNEGELINGELHANLRKWQINQLLYDNIDESNNKMNEDDKFIFDNYSHKNYNSELMLKELNYE